MIDLFSLAGDGDFPKKRQYVGPHQAVEFKKTHTDFGIYLVCIFFVKIEN